jgi:hypothetical protein
MGPQLPGKHHATECYGSGAPREALSDVPHATPAGPLRQEHAPDGGNPTRHTPDGRPPAQHTPHGRSPRRGNAARRVARTAWSSRSAGS